MFLIAYRTDPNQLPVLTSLDNSALLKQSLSSWSIDTKGFIQRLLSVIEKEYIPTFNKQGQLPILLETQDVLSGTHRESSYKSEVYLIIWSNRSQSFTVTFVSSIISRTNNIHWSISGLTIQTWMQKLE